MASPRGWGTGHVGAQPVVEPDILWERGAEGALLDLPHTEEPDTLQTREGALSGLISTFTLLLPLTASSQV